MPADEYGQSLKGLGLNLLVKSIEAARPFQLEVLGAQEIYWDADVAIYRGYGAEWMLHADHTYLDHELSGSLSEDIPRGVGVEIRLHDCNPDQAERVARKLSYHILAGSMDKPHGLREAYIIDQDGYCWVPDIPASSS